MMKTFSLRCHRLLFAKLPIYIQRNFLSINFDPNPTATKLTLVEAEISRSVNDHHHHHHHHHHHGRHHRGHHHHNCLAWSWKGSYFGYLINRTIFLYIWKIFVLLSSAGLFPWCTNGPTIQSHTVRSKAFYSHIYKQIFLVTRFKEKKGNRQCAALGFPPSDEVIQELSGVEHCRLLSDQDKETKSHERSTWRLRTPTICRRSVPA